LGGGSARLPRLPRRAAAPQRARRVLTLPLNQLALQTSLDKTYRDAFAGSGHSLACVATTVTHLHSLLQLALSTFSVPPRMKGVAVISAENHKRQRRKRQSVTANP